MESYPHREPHTSLSMRIVAGECMGNVKILRRTPHPKTVIYLVWGGVQEFAFLTRLVHDVGMSLMTDTYTVFMS